MNKKYQPGDSCEFCGVEVKYHDEIQIVECWREIQREARNVIAIEQLIKFGSVCMEFGVQTFDKSDKEITADNFKSWVDVEKWIATDGIGLYLWGPPGTGKTYAARAVLFQAMDAGKSVLETTAYKMLKYERCFGNEALIRKFETVNVLLIDDIDKAEWTSASLTFLWNLLNERMNNRCKTILTSNIKPENLRGVLAGGTDNNGSKIEATLQRLHPITVLEFAGKSLRGIA